jgi:hypothetical protein
MRSLILIVVYLSKDISKRWFETPGAVLARVSIAVSLCLLFLLMQAGFILAEHAIEKKIESFGINSMILRTSSPSNGSLRPELSTLFEPLAEEGLYFPFSSLYSLAELSNGEKMRVIVYGEDALPALSEMIDGFDQLQADAFLLAHGYPESLIERVRLRDNFFDSVVVYPPAVLRFVTLSKPVLFIPAAKIHAIGLNGMQESLFYVSDEPGELEQVIESMEAVLEAEGFQRYNLTSPVQWVGELKDLRQSRIKAQAFGGVFVGLLVILIFGSIAVFEYRQNIFATALFKSFGLSSLHLAVRYLLESLLLLGIAFYSAIKLAELIHEFVFVLAGFDSEFVNLKLFNPYVLSDQRVLLAILGVAGVVAVLPVFLGLCKPVGKSLG